MLLPWCYLSHGRQTSYPNENALAMVLSLPRKTDQLSLSECSWHGVISSVEDNIRGSPVFYVGHRDHCDASRSKCPLLMKQTLTPQRVKRIANPLTRRKLEATCRKKVLDEDVVLEELGVSFDDAEDAETGQTGQMAKKKGCSYLFNTSILFDYLQHTSTLFDYLPNTSTLFDYLPNTSTLFDYLPNTSTLFDYLPITSTLFDYPITSTLFDYLPNTSALIYYFFNTSTLFDYLPNTSALFDYLPNISPVQLSF
ncbi:hypothetical protein RRG08_055252 [Elysia crispata]|uniref:Uncharacterized protein n=1 Tax=Elysia crispata TaxID=231223 RepID=A0AAE0XV11_9GAST|nr:hypothetical protein RRG08_055252 [Elysia crispata]